MLPNIYLTFPSCWVKVALFSKYKCISNGGVKNNFRNLGGMCNEFSVNFTCTTRNNILGNEGEIVVQREKSSPETLGSEDSVAQILSRQARYVRHWAIEVMSSLHEMNIAQQNLWSLHISSDETGFSPPTSCATMTQVQASKSCQMDVEGWPTNFCPTDIEVVVVKF